MFWLCVDLILSIFSYYGDVMAVTQFVGLSVLRFLAPPGESRAVQRGTMRLSFGQSVSI